MRCRRVDGDSRSLESVLEDIYIATSQKSEAEYLKRKETLIKRLEELYELFIRPIADLLKPMDMEDKLIFVGSEVRIGTSYVSVLYSFLGVV